MTERQENILKYVVQSYVKTALPVGSGVVAQVFDCSSATVRNEMATLEKEGFLMQPHTSAGRVPTDAGYRYYVNLLMDDRTLSVSEQRKLQSDMLQLQSQYKRLARITAKLLSSYSDSMVLSGVKEQGDYASSGVKELLKHPEFKDSSELEGVFDAMDRFEEIVDVLAPVETENENVSVRTYIGDENPIDQIKNCSLVVSEFELPNGEHGVIAVLGPKRMKYERNISLVDYITKLLGGGALIMLLTITF